MKVVLAALLLLFTCELPAIVVTPLSIDELVAQADLVVRAEVISKSCQRDAAGRIYTRVELQVLELWKGKLGPEPLYVVHGGGVLGEERVVVSGQVHYRIGEEVVAFLIRNTRGDAVTLAMAQGKFVVSKSGPDGELQVWNGVHGSAPHAAKSKSDRPLKLSTLKGKVTGARM